MMGYPSSRLLEEVAYIAYYFHWPHDEILNMDHRERNWWVAEISKINHQLDDRLDDER